MLSRWCIKTGRAEYGVCICWANHPYQTSFFDKAKPRTGRSTNTNINSDCSALFLWNEHFFRYVNVRYMHDQWHRLNIKCLYVHIMNALDDFASRGRAMIFFWSAWFYSIQQKSNKLSKGNSIGLFALGFRVHNRFSALLSSILRSSQFCLHLIQHGFHLTFFIIATVQIAAPF